jgi:uncharacterized protein YciI
MPMFHVTIARSGPDWQHGRPLEQQTGWEEHAAFMDALVDDGFLVLGGPLADEGRVVHAVEAPSEEHVRAILARDPWSGTHLVVEAVEGWTIRLDGRRRTAVAGTGRPE